MLKKLRSVENNDLDFKVKTVHFEKEIVLVNPNYERDTKLL